MKSTTSARTTLHPSLNYTRSTISIRQQEACHKSEEVRAAGKLKIASGPDYHDQEMSAFAESTWAYVRQIRHREIARTAESVGCSFSNTSSPSGSLGIVEGNSFKFLCN